MHTCFGCLIISAWRRELQVSARHPEAKGKAWIFKKKEQARRKGYVGIPVDTKYTGRKRKSPF